jgi:hypothetical protein
MPNEVYVNDTIARNFVSLFYMEEVGHLYILAGIDYF